MTSASGHHSFSFDDVGNERVGALLNPRCLGGIVAYLRGNSIVADAAVLVIDRLPVGCLRPAHCDQDARKEKSVKWKFHNVFLCRPVLAETHCFYSIEPHGARKVHFQMILGHSLREEDIKP